MSPEQALGREVDGRTDLFSLGVVLYEMVTGRLPFSGAERHGVLIARILHAQPEAMARFNYETPAGVRAIVRKCLEKDRERRYQSARELLVDLRNLERAYEPSMSRREARGHAASRTRADRRRDCGRRRTRARPGARDAEAARAISGARRMRATDSKP